MIPMYNTVTFNQVWDSYEKFVDPTEGYLPSEIENPLNETTSKTLFYLLSARYGNNPITNNSIDQFKLKVFSIIFEYGPTWQKRLAIQTRLRNLSEKELREGAKQIYNHSFNPSTQPSTDTLDELLTIDDQNVNKNRKGILDAYAYLWEVLKVDVTEEFLGKFKSLFKIFVDPDITHIYEEDKEEM